VEEGRVMDMKEVIKIVYHKEVGNFLESLIRHEKLGEATCYICGTKVTLENFMALTRKSGRILFCCNKIECYRSFNDILRNE